MRRKPVILRLTSIKSSIFVVQINRIMETKKLTRSKNKMLGGVCAGIAEYFNLDPTLVRIGYVLLSVFSAAFPGILAYIVMLIVMPQAD